jgi:predicted ATP-dependent serine protease
MADAPWRCSQCGTVNEPVANACRTCGRWPSLFDLQESLVEDVELETVEEPRPVSVAVEVEDVQPFEPEIFEVDQPEPAELESPTDRGRRIIGSVIVPLAVVIYLLVMLLTNR